MAAVMGIARRTWCSAWTLLVIASLFWAGNIIIGRAVAGRVPPIALAYWRWTGAVIVAIGFAWPFLKRDWPVLCRHWGILVLLSATGVASYNTMSYIGLQYTTALNALLFQSAMPVIILLWAFALFGERSSFRQTLGVMLSLLGVAIIVSHGSLATLAHLSGNAGDAWILGGIFIYGLYPPLLRRRPVAHPLSFPVAVMVVADSGAAKPRPSKLLMRVPGLRRESQYIANSDSRNDNCNRRRVKRFLDAAARPEDLEASALASHGTCALVACSAEHGCPVDNSCKNTV
jgi:hypothetical protein